MSGREADNADTSKSDLEKARTRSVDNLQRLYTVVVSLAITESLRRILQAQLDLSASIKPGYESWLMFSALIVTIVPFYHGANRYLDATYVTGERTANPVALMIDFLALLIEGLALFAVAMLVGKAQEFYVGLACLLVFDAIWVGFTRLVSKDNGGERAGYLIWLTVNLLAAISLYLSFCSNILSFKWNTFLNAQIAGLLIAVFRTVFDYWWVWGFYYPNRLTPTPLPAPVPPTKGKRREK